MFKLLNRGENFMKKLISIILTIVLSFFMFYCTSTFATTETQDAVNHVYTDGNDGKENIKSNQIKQTHLIYLKNF